MLNQAQDILCQVPLNSPALISPLSNDRFTVWYRVKGDYYVPLFPGLTGTYEWALNIALTPVWRNGRCIPSDAMRIYKVVEGVQ